jgi:hypothetical protein
MTALPVQMNSMHILRYSVAGFPDHCIQHLIASRYIVRINDCFVIIDI